MCVICYFCQPCFFVKSFDFLGWVCNWRQKYPGRRNALHSHCMLNLVYVDLYHVYHSLLVWGLGGVSMWKQSLFHFTAHKDVHQQSNKYSKSHKVTSSTYFCHTVMRKLSLCKWTQQTGKPRHNVFWEPAWSGNKVKCFLFSFLQLPEFTWSRMWKERLYMSCFSLCKNVGCM